MEKKKEEREKKTEEDKVIPKQNSEAEKIEDKNLRDIKIKHKQNKQLKWAIFLMISLILIIILTPIIKHNVFDKFVYINLDFEKTRLGEIKFFSTRVPLADSQGTITGLYSINFRSDPRKMQDIIVDVPENKVAFEMNKVVYISLNPNMKKCDDNTIAMMGLASFLRGFGGLNISSAVSDKNYSQSENITYVTCENNTNNTVIWITSGSENLIKRTDKNCYMLVYENCEGILRVTEKFSLIILEDYMSYFTRK